MSMKTLIAGGFAVVILTILGVTVGRDHYALAYPAPGTFQAEAYDFCFGRDGAVEQLLNRLSASERSDCHAVYRVVLIGEAAKGN